MSNAPTRRYTKKKAGRMKSYHAVLEKHSLWSESPNVRKPGTVNRWQAGTVVQNALHPRTTIGDVHDVQML